MKTHFYKSDSIAKEDRYSFDTVDYSRYVFFTVDREIQFGEVLKIKGKLYSCDRGTRKEDDYYIGVSEIIMKDNEDITTEYENEITCPVCGYEWSDSWEYTSDSDELDCPECQSLISYQRNVTVDYTCDVVKKNDQFTEVAE